MSAAIDLRGIPEIQKMLAQWVDPALSRRSQRALRKGANTLARPMRSEARKVSKRMGKAVWVHAAKRDKPAMVVGHRARLAYFWHMVMGGTRDHGPRGASSVLDFIPGWNKYKGTPAPTRGYVSVRRVRGVGANPIVERVASQYGQTAYDAIAADLAKDE